MGWFWFLVDSLGASLEAVLVIRIIKISERLGGIFRLFIYVNVCLRWSVMATKIFVLLVTSLFHFVFICQTD